MEQIINDLKNDIDNTINNLGQKQYQKLLDHLSKKYYDDGISIISDEIFDYIYEHFEKLYGKYIYNGTIDRIKARLPYYVGSQNKIKASDKVINSWKNKYEGPYVLSTKINGVSCLCVKTNDIVQIFTKDVTGKYGYEKTKYIDKIDIHVQHMKNNDAIRGELIISKKHFDKYYAIDYSDTL
jgi:DNA ligase (NAD+)